MKLLRSVITASAPHAPGAGRGAGREDRFRQGVRLLDGRRPMRSRSARSGATTSRSAACSPRFDQEIAAQGLEEGDADQAEHHRGPARRHPDQAQRQHLLQRHGRLRLPLRRFRRHGHARTTVVSEYTVGTLVVDMFDAKTKNLVFRGTAEDEISDNPEKNTKRLEKASTKMFKNFPPTKASSARRSSPTRPPYGPPLAGRFFVTAGRHSRCHARPLRPVA